MSQMTRNKREICRKALRDAFAASKPADSDAQSWNPADDLEFLEALDANELTVEERDQFIQRLAECPNCREEIAAQIKFGGLFADADEQTAEEFGKLNETRRASLPQTTIATTRDEAPKTRNRNLKFSLLTSAALVAVAIGGVAIWGVSGGNRSEDLARRLNEIPEVAALEDFSPNLSETFGYRLSGRSKPKSKGLLAAEPLEPKTDAAFENASALFEDALKAEPQNNEMRLKYARYLIKKEKNLRRADEILAATNAQTAEVALLSGVSAFLQKDDVKAEAAFRRALTLDAGNETALLNLAICLSQSENSDAQNEALDIYRRLRDTTTSESLRLKIESRLEDVSNADSDKSELELLFERL